MISTLDDRGRLLTLHKAGSKAPVHDQLILDVPPKRVYALKDRSVTHSTAESSQLWAPQLLSSMFLSMFDVDRLFDKHGITKFVRCVPRTMENFTSWTCVECRHANVDASMPFSSECRRR